MIYVKVFPLDIYVFFRPDRGLAYKTKAENQHVSFFNKTILCMLIEKVKCSKELGMSSLVDTEEM